jgi:hypothetical protein
MDDDTLTPYARAMQAAGWCPREPVEPKAPNPETMWLSPPKCEHDWQREGKHFMCSKCRRMEYEHMLECVEGKWRQKEVKVRPWKGRRR